MDGIKNHCSFFEGKVRSGTHRRRVRIDKSSHADCLEEMCVFHKEPRRQICKHMHKPIKLLLCSLMLRQILGIVQCPGGTFDEPGGLFDSIGKGPLEWSSNGTSLWSLFEEELDSAPFVNNKAAIEMLE